MITINVTMDGEPMEIGVTAGRIAVRRRVRGRFGPFVSLYRWTEGKHPEAVQMAIPVSAGWAKVVRARFSPALWDQVNAARKGL